MMFGHPYRHNIETPQDQAHCRLDLDAVHDAASAARFVARWRLQLEGYLIDPPAAPDGIAAGLEAAVCKAEEQLGAVRENLEAWISRVEDLQPEKDAFSLATEIERLSDQVGACIDELAKVEGVT